MDSPAGAGCARTSARPASAAARRAPPRRRPRTARRSSATRARSDSAKSSSPAIARSVIAATSLGDAGPLRPARRSPRPGSAWSRRRARPAAWRAGAARPARRRCPRRCPRPPARASRAAPRGSPVRTIISIALAGSVDSWVTDSMLSPMSAMRCATWLSAPGRSGRPSTMTWLRGAARWRCRSGCVGAVGDRRPRTPCRAREAAWVTELRSAPGSPRRSNSTARISRSRITTCSTSRMSTSCAASAEKNAAVTPGRSRPVIVASTDVGCMEAGPPTSRTSRRTAEGVTARLGLEARIGVPVRACPRARTVDAGARASPLGTGVSLAGVRLGLEPLEQVRVVVLERRPLGADPRDRGEVVPRRRAGGRPFQRVAVSPTGRRP